MGNWMGSDRVADRNGENGIRVQSAVQSGQELTKSALQRAFYHLRSCLSPQQLPQPAELLAELSSRIAPEA